MEKIQAVQERISHLGKTLRFFINLVFTLLFLGFAAVYLPKAAVVWKLAGEELIDTANRILVYLIFAVFAAKIFFYYATFQLFKIAFKAEEENRTNLIAMVRDEFLKYWPVRYVIKKICQFKERK